MRGRLLLMLNYFYSIFSTWATMLAIPTVLQSLAPASPGPWRRPSTLARRRKMEHFATEVEALFGGPLAPSSLLSISQRLQDQFKERLQSSSISMLPSYNHTLPHGNETGTYLAVDVGGSTLRVALVDLAGRDGAEVPMKIARMDSWKIDDTVKALKGLAFFDWMAGRIDEMLAKDPMADGLESRPPLPMGLAWSFPIKQTSIRSGTLLSMGKGCSADQGVLGQDLGELITQACQRQGMNVKLDAIVNDSSATLLSRAYLDKSTRLALILGTGLNAAIHLPVSALALEKFGSRPQNWHDHAAHVLVNTELSMFGKDIVPTTRWDDYLNATHLLPDYQPLEHLISGRYLGEIVRLILVEAIQTVGLFGGVFPSGFTEAYAFCTSVVATAESDTSPYLETTRRILQKHHPHSTIHSHADLLFVQRVCRSVSHRAAAYLAAGIHALWSLRNETEGLSAVDAGRVAIGCNGSVIEKYPGFSAKCQTTIDALVDLSGGQSHSVLLEPAIESAIFGAAVAVSCVEAEGM